MTRKEIDKNRNKTEKKDSESGEKKEDVISLARKKRNEERKKRFNKIKKVETERI